MLGLPDLAYLLVASGLVALGWGILRPVLAYFALRQSDVGGAARTPVVAS
jgi:hypothetical protein